MPGTTSYSTQYVEATRARVAQQITMYRGFAAAATTPAAERLAGAFLSAIDAAFT